MMLNTKCVCNTTQVDEGRGPKCATKLAAAVELVVCQRQLGPCTTPVFHEAGPETTCSTSSELLQCILCLPEALIIITAHHGQSRSSLQCSSHHPAQLRITDAPWHSTGATNPVSQASGMRERDSYLLTDLEDFHAGL